MESISGPPVLLLLILLLLVVYFPFRSSASPFAVIRSRASFSLSVIDYGAIGDGRKYDTLAIQSAIEDCSAAFENFNAHCYVNFPAGNYLTRTLYLRSGVVLNISSDATLLGGSHLEDYPEQREKWYVVLAEDAAEVGITGGGEINGQGLKFVKRFDHRKNVMVSWNQTGACLGDECRPRLVGFIGCRDITISNVSFNQPAYWCLHIVRSENTLIHDVSVSGDFNTPNNDGIDIEDSNNTFISRCRIDTGDDAICLKTSTAPVYNLTAVDCWIRSKSSAIKLGSASWFSFRGLLFDKITITESHRGLGMQIRDGGNVSDVTFSNINITTRYYDESWWGRAEPIYITSCPRDEKATAGSITDIKFINITATSENGAFLSGFKGQVLSDIKFINVNLMFKRWTNFSGGEVVDYRPGCQGLISRSTGGFMMEYIDGLHVNKMMMSWVADDDSEKWDNPILLKTSTVNNLWLENFSSVLKKGT